MKFSAREELSSQFEGKRALDIGTLSVCPEITTRSEIGAKDQQLPGQCAAIPVRAPLTPTGTVPFP